MSTTYDETSMGFYDTYFGTSMASPVAAGAASLILAMNPELTPDEVEEIMKSTAANIDGLNPGYEGMLGAGRIDAYEAVISTPYEPVAAFSTPVTVITPGTSIDFTSESEGIPDTYAWTFDGGTPQTSTAMNPQDIEYTAEGVFNVSLTVVNDYGESVLLKEEYITVTSTPAPYVDFSASEESTCILDAVSFTDLSLYDPNQWLWEFDPPEVTFLEGTNDMSQNPVVQFDTPGYYEVTLTATNGNGSSSLTKTDYIWAEGINLPLDETFESGETTNFTLSANEKGNVKIDKRAAMPGSEYGLHFQGNTSIGGWTGSPTATTPEQAWEDNTEFHSMASNCAVDATGVSGIALTFDLRQTYAFGPKNSWFRVLVNDEQMTDIVGTSNFNPETENDPFETRMFDLSQYGNSFFSLSLQAACYLSDYFYEGKGDNVFVDNITIYNFTGTGEQENKASALMYPVPAKDFVNISVAGIDENYTISIYNVQGQKVFESTEYSFVNDGVESLNISSLERGVYLLKVNTSTDEITKKLIVR
ncbi:MAG: PKD domain-containing protein [Bacteroidota bacterium]|nr:PKD domain-containing protein [Bacteroidota bacterium]